MEETKRIEELEILLLDDSKAYSDKLDAVVSTWKYYYEVANDKETPDILNQVFPPLYRAAVRIILHGDWPRLNHVKRRKFTSLIKRSNSYLYRKFPDSAKKCKALTFLWVDPWDNPTLRQILEKATAPDDDVCDLMTHEGPELLFLRLEAMCEGKCEDLALQLAACYLKHLRENNDCHDVDVDEMNDVFMALLYKFNKKTEVVDMLKRTKLTDGVKLVKRMLEKSKNKGRLWKHFEKMHAFALKTLIDMAMDICLDLEEDRLQASQVMDVWINMNVSPIMISDESLKQVSEVVRRLVGTAGSARHIYLFSQTINKKYGDRLKLLCIELYIRGLTLNLNEIEELKALGDEKIIQANKDLADGFLQLAELFSGNESVCRECILSSFALSPTKETLLRIQTLLKVEDGAKPTDSCSASGRLEKCSYHDKYNCACSSSNFIAIQLDQDILKSAPHLPDDLALVLSRSRPKSLTWSLGKRLDGECQKYLKNYTGPEVNKQPELQFLNIDYSQFKNWPKEEPVKPKPKIRPNKATGRPRGRPKKDSLSPAYKKMCTLELLSDSSSSPEECDDPDYVPEINFQAIKPATQSVGTSVSLPRARRESSTQTEAPILKTAAAFDPPSPSPASVRQVASSSLGNQHAIRNQPVAIETPVVKQLSQPPVMKQPYQPQVIMQRSQPAVMKQSQQKHQPPVTKQQNQPPLMKQQSQPSILKRQIQPPVMKQLIRPTVMKQQIQLPVVKQSSASLHSEMAHPPPMAHLPSTGHAFVPVSQPIPVSQPVAPPHTGYAFVPVSQPIPVTPPTSKEACGDTVNEDSSSQLAPRIPGSPAKCTAAVSSFELSKPVRTYFNRKTANLASMNAHRSHYLNNHSPKPAEVPPTASSDIRIQEKLKPILKSLDLNPKVVLEDILSVNRTSTQLPRESAEKRGFPDRDSSLDILAQAVMRSDILLAKSVPGMNSVEMIVPGPQETAVNVVQISNSAPVLPQPAVTTVVASSSLSHSIHTSNSSIIQSNTPSSLSRLKTADSGFQADCSSSSLLADVNKTHDAPYASTQADNSTSPMIPSSSSAETRMNPIQLISTNPTSGRNIKSNLPSTSDQVTSVSEIPCSSQQEGTLVTAHIQRVGQPMKQRTSTDMAMQRANSTNPVLNSDEINKIPQGQVFRLIVKDGRVVEQYYQGNQSLEPVLSIPDSEETESLPSLSNSYNHDNFIKLLKKKNDLKNKPVTKSTDNPQVSSLPKFHHVFGRQIYQSDTISLESSAMSSHTQYEERSNNPEVKSQTDHSSTGLSKAVQCSAAVQTILKEAESPKTVGKQRADVQTHLQSSALPTSSSSVVTSESKGHSNEMPSSSGVIFTCKVPLSISNQTMIQGKPVTILKTTSTSSESQCTKVVDQEGRSKDSVIRTGNMNALLAAALQSASPIKHTVINNPSNVPVTVSGIKHIKVNNSEGIMMQKIRMPTPVQKTIRRTAPAQPSRYMRPMIQVSTGNSMTQTGPPVVTIPLPTRTVVLAATNVGQNALQSNLPKMDGRQDHLNSEQASVSSTTLEQLREFESVLEQVTNTSQMKERGNVKKVEHQPTQTTSTDFPVSASKVNPIFQSSLVSTISDLNNESVSLTFINKNVCSTSTSMCSSNQSKVAASTPVVVVQSCSRPLASPALSITSQSSLSPAPQTSPAHIPSKIGAKVTKPKVKSSVGKTAPTTTIKVSTLPKPQQKPQEDEQTTQRIYAILDKYAEQLRNSPELKNKPAPRRRSNPPTNPTQSSKRKKSSHSKSKSVSNLPTCSGSEMSPGSEDLRTLGSEDSSNGVSQLSQVLNSPQSRNDEHSNPPGGDVSSEASESLDSKDQRPQHRLLLTEPSSSSGRTVLVQENIQPLINVDGPKVLAGKQLVVGSGATVPLTLSLPAGNVKQVIFPVPADGRPFVVAKVPKMYRVHQVTMPTGSPLLATAGSGAVVLRQMCLNKANSGVKQVKLPVVSQIQTQGLNNITSQPAVVLPSGSQSFTLATSSALDGDSLGITLDNTILLNTSTSQSLGFFQRNVTKSVGSQQSPNLLVPSSRATLDANSSIGHFPGNSESPANVKCDNTVSDTLITTISDEQNKSCNSSSQNTGFKNEELRFAVSSGIMVEKQSVSSPDLMSSNPKNWSHTLEEAKGGEGLSSEDQKSAEQDLKMMKAEFHCIGRSDAIVEPVAVKAEENEKTPNQSDSVIKTKMKEEAQYNEGQGGEKSCLSIQQDSSDQWQFNLAKVESATKDIKPEAAGQEIVKSNSGILMNNINHSIGVKRKLNVENTIFQVAFKRNDKLKLVKDEFIHQRNSANSLEREIRLQKSLSEECEDLGVDKPRTSELFPEAELLLDSDPLSRDSLQEIYSRGIESSSSSHDSPLRSSPTVLSDNSHCKFSSLTWKKQKGVSTVKSTDNAADKMMMKLDSSDVKSESSCESSPLNGSSEPSNSTLGGNGKTSNFKANPSSMKKDSSVPSCSRDEITTPDSDNCHFSEVDDNCIDPDLIDTEVESDSDTQSHTCKQTVYAVESMHENESNDKTADFSLPANQKCNPGSYPNKEESFKGKLDTNLQWFNIDQDGHKGSTAPSEETNKTREESAGDATLNGILLDEWNSHRDDSVSDRNLRRSRSASSSFYPEADSPKAKKKKKPSIFVASGGEDSGSSMDILTGGEDDLELDSMSRRSSSRGRVKKGCPCFNGAPDPKKKKDLSSGPFLKTDKPNVSKSVNFPVSPLKKAQKLTTIKSPNKKR